VKKLPALAAVAIAVALAVTGCGGGGDQGSQTTAQFNDADVTFAQGMIPHHRQAIEMAKLAQERAATADVKQLAADIEKAQDPEIQTMTGWLRAWGKELPETSSMEHGGMEMPGMMSEEDMKGLQNASGTAFDRMFLQMMIKHHEGAIDMARTEQANGKNADAIALAKQIETAQTKEISHIRQLLAS
jgi:uncharacterized protein (DUF305 family)